MDNFSAHNERNFHNLVVNTDHMHLLDEPSGYASAMVKNSLSHQMRFTVQMLEEELCAAGNPHVLQMGPTLGSNSGMRFPLVTQKENSFPKRDLWETGSQIECSKWDAFSRWHA